jgi:hypothetical protein
LTDDMVVSSPAVANGVVYFGSYDHVIYAVGTPSERSYPFAAQPILLLASIIAAFAVLAIAILAFVILRKRHPEIFGGQEQVKMRLL